MDPNLITWMRNKLKRHDTDLADMANEWKSDFSNSTGLAPYSGWAILDGSLGQSSGTSKHPGIVALASGASANSGYKIGFPSNCYLLGGGEKATFVFKAGTTLTGVTTRLGFLDTVNHLAPTDGVYCSIIDGVISGRAVNNTTLSTTESTYTITANTWYRLVIEINTNATLVTFKLYADDSETVLWTDILDGTNIPKTAGRETGVGLVTSYSGTSAMNISFLDYINLFFMNARRV